MFPLDNAFFKFLAYASDHKQKRNVIKLINKSQLNTLKSIPKSILNGDIQLKKVQFRCLKNKKLFLRRLSQGKIKNKDLSRNYFTACHIVKIALEHYEKHPKISSDTNRKVGENRRQNPVKKVTVKSVPQKNISHQKNHVSQIENMKVTDQ